MYMKKVTVLFNISFQNLTLAPHPPIERVVNVAHIKLLPQYIMFAFIAFESHMTGYRDTIHKAVL